MDGVGEAADASYCCIEELSSASVLAGGGEKGGSGGDSEIRAGLGEDVGTDEGLSDSFTKLVEEFVTDLRKGPCCHFEAP